MSGSGEFAGKRVVIFGIGQFGGQIEAARFFAREGASVLAIDLKDASKLGRALEALADLPVELRLGPHREADFLAADLVVVSPAVPKTSPFFRLVRERGIPWTTELNLTLPRLRAPVYAVTGSNGKSTTTALLGEVVAAASGRRAWTGGNIGRPLLNEAAETRPEDRAVLELSSFQLEDLAEEGIAFAPALALVTNVTPNHLDRHGTLEAYTAIKRSLVERLAPGGAAVLSREDPVVRGFAAAAAGRVGARFASFGFESDFAGAGSFVRPDGTIAVRDEVGRERAVVPLGRLRILGRHNALTALAVAAAAAAEGLDLERSGAAIAAFGGLRDRLEVVSERGAVRFVNDSKATTPEAAAAGICAFPPGLTLIAGGADKGMDFAPFARAARERAARGYLIGQMRERLRDALGAGLDVRLEDSLEAAVLAAARATPAGSTVLFSPACASYDMFVSFEERGERFRAAVRALDPEAEENGATS